MRELEFLPEWYNQTRRRKRFVALQSWIFFTLLAGLGAWIGLAHRSASAAENQLAALQRQLAHTHAEQKALSEQLALQRELQTREQLIASLGLPVQTTRIIQTIDSVMPKEMSLTEIECNLEEQVRTATSVAGLRPGAEKEKHVDRRLKVRLLGVAPSSVDMATFVQGLAVIPFFDQVNIASHKERVEAGHVVQDFEVTFSMGLNP